MGFTFDFMSFSSQIRLRNWGIGFSIESVKFGVFARIGFQNDLCFNRFGVSFLCNKGFKTIKVSFDWGLILVCSVGFKTITLSI